MGIIEDELWVPYKDLCAKDGSVIEVVISEFYKTVLSPDSDAIDGGAHLAYHTLRLAACVPEGLVVGIEANPAMYEQLKPRCWKTQNVRLECAALAERRGTVEFNVCENMPGRSGVNRLWDEIDGSASYNEPIRVPAVTIDELATRHHLSKLGFIKLDLEGGELPALRGGWRTIKAQRPLAVTEYCPQALQIHGTTPANFAEELKQIGYGAYSPNGQKLGADAQFPFWYLFLVPDEEHHRLSDLVNLTRSHCEKSLELAKS